MTSFDSACSEVKLLDRQFFRQDKEKRKKRKSPATSFQLRRDFLGDSHAVKELPVRLVSFALGHQAVQLVNELGLDLRGRTGERRGKNDEETERKKEKATSVGELMSQRTTERKGKRRVGVSFAPELDSTAAAT